MAPHANRHGDADWAKLNAEDSFWLEDRWASPQKLRRSGNTAHLPFLPGTSAEDVIDQPARAQFEAFLDEQRSDLNHCLDGLGKEQARRSLVPSRTTLLGLVKHATLVEKVWFDYGNRRGPLPLRWVYLHMLRELARHCGHVDILRELIVNREPRP